MTHEDTFVQAGRKAQGCAFQVSRGTEATGHRPVWNRFTNRIFDVSSANEVEPDGYRHHGLPWEQPPGQGKVWYTTSL